MTTSADIVNRAIQLIGGFNNNGPVTGNPPLFDESSYGIAAGVLYNDVVQTVAREWGYDFSRNTAVLALTGNTPPDPSYQYEYAYPTNGIQVRQLVPPALADLNNPLPLCWTVGNNLVGSPGVPTKVIWATLASAKATFTNQPLESLWDPLFTEAVVRLLASGLAMAVEARPDTSNAALETSQSFNEIGQTRDS
jgi:hypothetical protein